MQVWGRRARSPSCLLGTSLGPGGARLQKPQKPSPRLGGGAFRSSSSKPRPAPTCMYCSILSKAVKCASVSEPMRAAAWKIVASWNGGEASRQVAAGSVQLQHPDTRSLPWPLRPTLLPTRMEQMPAVPLSPLLSLGAAGVGSLTPFHLSPLCFCPHLRRPRMVQRKHRAAKACGSSPHLVGKGARR